MARIRTVKPEFFRHEELFDAEKATGLPLRLAFIGLWTVADREGRFHWRPRALKPDVLPYDEIDFATVLEALAAHNFILRYRCDGNEYGLIPNFAKHQCVNVREAKSTIPAPETHVQARASTEDARGEREVEREVEGKKDDDDRADAKNLTLRVCEILGVTLQADPDRITWPRQIEQMLRDGLSETEIIRAAEVTRAKGKASLSYLRAVAFSPPKPAAVATPPPKPTSDEIGERLKAKWAREDEQAGRLRGGAETDAGGVFPAVARGSG